MKNPQFSVLNGIPEIELLKVIKDQKPKTTLSREYGEYTLEAIKLQTVNYLLSTIDIGELMELVVELRARTGGQQGRGTTVFKGSSKLGFPIATGQEFIGVEEVIYAKAKDNVVELSLLGKKKIKLTKTMSWLEDYLDGYGFFRVHHSYMINLSHLKEYIRNEGGYVIMSNGKAISISRRRREAFLNLLERR